MPDEFMSTTAVAEELGVTPETVRRWIRDRKLRSVALTQSERAITFRVRRADFEAFRDAYVRDTLTDDWER